MADDPAPSTPLLDSLLAALSKLGPDERVRWLRAYLEYGLDLLEANELEHFRFLGECALLAVENMQDVRLENVELRVRDLQQPPEKAWGEVLTDVMLGLAVELVALALVEIAATAVISMAGYKAIQAAKSAAEAELVAARSESTEIGKLLAETVAHQGEARGIVENLEAMSKRGGYRSKLARRGGWLIQPYDWGEAFHLPQEALHGVGQGANPAPFIRKYNELTVQVHLGQSASKSSAKRMESARQLFDQALEDGRTRERALKEAWGKDWREFIGGERGGPLLSLTSSVLTGPAETRSPAQDAPAGSDRPFLTSEVAARYLDWVADERMAVSSSYANMRFVLRTTSDEDIIAGDAYIHYLAYLATEVRAGLEVVRLRSQAGRSLFVEAFEAAFWREYLSANGMLAVDPVAEYRSRAFLEPGSIVGGHLITKEMEEVEQAPDVGFVPLLKRYRTWHLPGAMRLDERLAGVLYHRFARPYFADSGHAAALKPFVYQPADYDNVAIPPQDGLWGQPDPEAVKRINEMRHMVILFFADEDAFRPPDQLGEAAARLNYLGAVAGEEAERSRTAWLGSMPVGVDTTGQDAGLAEVDSTLQAEAQFAVLAGAPYEPGGLTVEARLVQLDLAVKLNDLNQDIQVYQFLVAGAVEPAEIGDRTKEDLLEEIAEEKTALTTAWDTLQGLVGNGQEQTLSYRAAYEAIMKWQPGSAWAWYGPDAQPEPQ